MPHGKSNRAALVQQQQNKPSKSILIICQSCNEWEKNARANDPDYDLKEDLIDARVQALRRELGSNGQLYTAQNPKITGTSGTTTPSERKYNATFGNRKPIKLRLVVSLEVVQRQNHNRYKRRLQRRWVSKLC